MAESASYSGDTDDISGLWGAEDEDVLEPPRPNGTVTNGFHPAPAPINGSHNVAGDPSVSVARLAEALAGHQVEVVRRSELSAMRTEMDDRFTQQLAVAIFELLSATNDRFASFEEHIDRHLHDVATELSRSITAQVDTQHRMAAELAGSARDELTEVGDRLGVPLETLAAFQREMRHEVGRVGDALVNHAAEAARRAEENAERVAQAEAAMADRLGRSEVTDAAAMESLERITERIASLQTDLAEAQEAMKAVREEISTLRGRPVERRRWGRSG
jgi:chromosome segregation ATPase